MNNNDIVIMKMEEYREKILKKDIEEHLLKAEDDIRKGKVRDAREVLFLHLMNTIKTRN